MRVRDGVLDVVVIFLTLALCVSCTGTRFNWRRSFKWTPFLYLQSFGKSRGPKIGIVFCY